MQTLDPIVLALVVLFLIISGFAVIVLLTTRGLKREVEEALREAADDDERQAEIRKKLVKALFPPRFNRD